LCHQSFENWHEATTFVNKMTYVDSVLANGICDVDNLILKYIVNQI